MAQDRISGYRLVDLQPLYKQMYSDTKLAQLPKEKPHLRKEAGLLEWLKDEEDVDWF